MATLALTTNPFAFNRSAIMKAAWANYRLRQAAHSWRETMPEWLATQCSFSTCLKDAWTAAREDRRLASVYPGSAGNSQAMAIVHQIEAAKYKSARYDTVRECRELEAQLATLIAATLVQEAA